MYEAINSMWQRYGESVRGVKLFTKACLELRPEPPAEFDPVWQLAMVEEAGNEELLALQQEMHRGASPYALFLLTRPERDRARRLLSSGGARAGGGRRRPRSSWAWTGVRGSAEVPVDEDGADSTLVVEVCFSDAAALAAAAVVAAAAISCLSAQGWPDP